MNKQRVWLGIDPGITGAAALVGQDGRKLVDVWDWSSLSSAKRRLLTWQGAYLVEAAGIESVWIYPRSGGGKRNIASANKLMRNLGQWEGLLHALSIPFLLVKPKSWQAVMLNMAGVAAARGRGTKKRSLAAARAKWGGNSFRLEKHHNRADAAWIAAYMTAYSASKVAFINKL